MHRFLFFFLFFSICAHAEWDHLFSEDDDPSLFHHVSVITGNLNLCLQDGVIQGAKPLPLFRTYSSAGALERKWKIDLPLREKRGLLIQGGWSFFPHANLLIEIDWKLSKMRAFLPERSGNFIEYAHPRKVEDGKRGERVLTPRLSAGQCAGNLSARTNPKNNLLNISIKRGFATLYLPDGGVRRYEGEKLGAFEHGDHRKYFYRLVSEKLPSGHQIFYDYDHKEQLQKIAIKNPSGSKTYAWAHIDLFKKSPPFHFQITTSDGKSFAYQALEFKERDYLASVKSNLGSEEICHYSPGRKGIGARVARIDRNGKAELQINYYLPPNEKAEKKWFYDSDKKGLSGDKVSQIEAPFGPNGEMQILGRFCYCQQFTDARDVDGILTRYFHDGHRITKIENFKESEILHSATKFLWEGDQLRCKVKLNAKDEPILAKTFQYDPAGNVVEETLWGNLTGNAAGPFSLMQDFTLAHAECLRKRFSYDPEFNLPILEEEEEGVTRHFSYKPGTDLLTLKLTCNKERILKREIFEYDADHLLVAEIVDDGASSNPSDLSGLTIRQIKRFTLDPASGLIKTLQELYFDPVAGSEILLKKTELSYSPENLVTKEVVYNASNTYRYTLFTDYEKGRVVRKTSPLGRENSYRYDAFGNLLEIKEVGSPYKTYTYDAVGRPLTCTERGSDGAEKTSKSVYDSKGRLLAQIDTRGNATKQTYDAFGRCLLTEFPTTQDEKGEVYTPKAYFTYDIQGNLASTTTTHGEATQTIYNALRKPIEITHADGAKILHTYNRNGTLQKTIYPDETAIHYTYDLFQRMTSKTVVAKSGEELSKEEWEYNTFQLLSHTDTRGLTTRYAYDGAGRKIAEEAEGRKKSFVYDALGFLERTTEGDVAHVQICDVEGQVVEEWTEETSGRTENWMRFFYNAEGKKEKVVRLTSRGEATDLFFYDSEGRLIQHIDPHESSTQFLFNEEVQNELGQQVQQKSVIDALGNILTETCDALNRVVQIEKKDPQGRSVSKEEYLYDRAGNRAKRFTYVFEKNRLVKQLSASWEYDSMGRVVKEIEDKKKVTTFTYDEKGRIKTRTLADGTILSHAYDGIDRLTELKSSDSTVHLRYFYRRGSEPTETRDLISGVTLQRNYNLFGELAQETSSAGMHYSWEYDHLGRVKKLTLPDLSAIAYAYEGNHLISVKRESATGASLYSHDYLHFDENGHVSEESTIHRKGGIRTTRDLLERPISFTSLWLQHRATYGPTNLVTTTKNSLFGEKTYTYDALNQLKQEGERKHEFDSVGNPSHCCLDSCNQIASFADTTLAYDENGNPLKRVSNEQQILYTYDPLGRLTSITQPESRRVRYLYDPLSRLLGKEVSLYKNGKWKDEAPIFYLYDQKTEIGTCSASGKIRELKVLGLGIRGEIGAAVAIEIGGKPFIPLHDFQGNIIALVSPDDEIAESYEISAFGKENFSSPPVNPWRFSSKRAEEGLVFFGKRFYDPSLGRWLTPDPAGFADGPNLYVFVLNSPLNRLDLFGLLSEPQFPELRMEIPHNRVSPPPSTNHLIPCKAFVGGVHVDWVVSCGHWHKLQFSAEELSTGKVNIVDHFHELLPKEGMSIGLITAQNGILTSLNDFSKNMCQSIRQRVPEGTLFIGMHNKESSFNDILHTTSELYFGKETSSVCTTRQALGALAEIVHKYNPESLWLHIIHSRSGITNLRAIEGMTPEQKALLKQHLYVHAAAPARPLPRSYGFGVYNIYSMDDFITGWSGILRLHNKAEYDITFIPSDLSCYEKTGFFADHAFMSRTQQSPLWERIRNLRERHGFHNGNAR